MKVAEIAYRCGGSLKPQNVFVCPGGSPISREDIREIRDASLELASVERAADHLITHVNLFTRQNSGFQTQTHCPWVAA